jgi:hypothetical protein
MSAWLHIVGLDKTVICPLQERFSKSILFHISWSITAQINYLPRSWMTSAVYFPRRLYVIGDLTHEYLAELRTRGNSDWIFYKDLATVESHF